MSLYSKKIYHYDVASGSYIYRDFYALTSAGPRWWWCNPSLKGEGFNDPKGPSRC